MISWERFMFIKKRRLSLFRTHNRLTESEAAWKNYESESEPREQNWMWSDAPVLKKQGRLGTWVCSYIQKYLSWFNATHLIHMCFCLLLLSACLLYLFVYCCICLFLCCIGLLSFFACVLHWSVDLRLIWQSLLVDVFNTLLIFIVLPPIRPWWFLGNRETHVVGGKY